MRDLSRRMRRLAAVAVDHWNDLLEVPPSKPEVVEALAELCGRTGEERARIREEHSRPRRVPRRLTEPLLEGGLHQQLSERCRMGPDGQPKEGW